MSGWTCQRGVGRLLRLSLLTITNRTSNICVSQVVASDGELELWCLLSDWQFTMGPVLCQYPGQVLARLYGASIVSTGSTGQCVHSTGC